MGGFLPSRRRFLGGAGVVLGLPFLESAQPRSAWGQAATPIKRIMPVWFPNGFDRRPDAFPGPSNLPVNGDWAAKNYAILAPMARLPNVKAKTLVLDGLCHVTTPYVHEAQTRGMLTGMQSGADDTNSGGGISYDQVIADAIGTQTRRASMQIGIATYAGGYDTRYLSWRGAGVGNGLPAVTDPQIVFNQIFEGFTPDVSGAETERRKRYETSILDYVLEEARVLKPKLAASDRMRFDMYTTQIREIETRINTTLQALTCGKPADPGAAARSLSYDKKLPMMMDLAVLALQCDVTRIITFFSNTWEHSHPWIGVNGGHHGLSHWGTDVNKQNQVRKIDIWQMEQYAYFVDKMDSVPDGDGKTLLDNSLMYFHSEIAEGDNHSRHNIPFIMNGTLGGLFPTGKYLRLQNGPEGGNFPVAWMYVSLMNAFGLNKTSFGSDKYQGDLLKTGQLR